VLVAGGYSSVTDTGTNTAELYDPATGSWRVTGSLISARNYHTATLLRDGKVLVAGGTPNNNGPNRFLSAAELYDPATGSWTGTGNLETARAGHTATLLPSGKVLVAGGNQINSAELYDPNTATWSATGSLNVSRVLHTATLLPNGEVLVAGGSDLNSTELYDLNTGTWRVTGNLNKPRSWWHTATLLPCGKVLVTDGYVSSSILGAELYDPDTGRWSVVSDPLNTRALHTATLLPNGKVLVAGGMDGDLEIGYQTLSSAELFDSSSLGSPNIDDAQFFVRQHYRDFLNREPDTDGLAFWTNEITSCGDNARCVEVKRINDSAAFYLSIEFQETGYLVYRTYKAAYGDLPDAPVPIRLNEFLPDTQKIGNGVVVNQPGWEQVLETNKQNFALEFVQRPRFTTAYPMSMSADEFVDKLFANAHVIPAAEDRAAAINEFSSAFDTSDAAVRSRVLRRTAENAALAQQEFNRAFVLMQYFGYLRRDPNQGPDTDFAGFNFWLNKLDGFSGNYIDAEMVNAFITSTEYRQRFGQ
jgi:hypothetical protein